MVLYSGVNLPTAKNFLCYKKELFTLQDMEVGPHVGIFLDRDITIEISIYIFNPVICFKE
jgi:hypothetical protein